MSRSIEITETERKLLARLIHEEWRRLDSIREVRSSFMSDDPILKDQQDVETLEGKLK